MRRFKLLLVPLTMTWFAGALWWLAHRDTCGCNAAAAAQVPAIATTITLGPAAPIPPTPARFVPDPILLQPLVIPFVKNRQEPGTNGTLLRYTEALRAALLKDPEASVSITGHTDADGDADLNRRLSSARAELVKAQLVALGLPEERLRTAGLGADRPLSDNLTSKGKALNRRVEIALDQQP